MMKEKKRQIIYNFFNKENTHFKYSPCYYMVVLFLSFYLNACNGCSNHNNEHDAGSDVIDDMAKDTEMDETKTEDIEKDIIEDSQKDAEIDWGDFQGEWINPWDMNNLGTCCDSRCRKITNIKEYMEKEYDYQTAQILYYDVYGSNVVVGVDVQPVFSAFLYYIDVKNNRIKELYNIKEKLQIGNKYNIKFWGTWGAGIYKSIITFPSSYAPVDELIITDLELYKYNIEEDKVEKLYYEKCATCYSQGDDLYENRFILESGSGYEIDLYMYDLNTMAKTRLTYTYSGMQSAYIYGRYVVVNYNNSVAYIDLEDPQYTLHRVVAHGPGGGWIQREGRIYENKIIFEEANSDTEIQWGAVVYIYNLEDNSITPIKDPPDIHDHKVELYPDIYINIVAWVENRGTTDDWVTDPDDIYIKNMETGDVINVTENFDSINKHPSYPRLTEGGLLYFEDMYVPHGEYYGGELWVCDYSDFFQ